jgi:UDP-N-acetylglucosamine 2-epimerase
MTTTAPVKAVIVDYTAVRDLTLEQLARRNAELTKELRQNISLLRLKKHELMNERQLNSFQKIISLERRVFAFRMIFPSNGNKIELINGVYDLIKDLCRVQLIKQFTINEYLYVKTKSNIILGEPTYMLSNGVKLEQVDPKYLFSLQTPLSTSPSK